MLSAQAAGGELFGIIDNIIVDVMDLDRSPGGWRAEVFGCLEEIYSENSPRERGRRG